MVSARGLNTGMGRAGGMVQIGEAISQLLAPAAAGALFVTIGLGGVIAIDFATYLFAVVGGYKYE